MPFHSSVASPLLFLLLPLLGAAACSPVVIEVPQVVQVRPSSDILDTLRALDGVTAYEIPTALDGARVFSLTLEQREDHDDLDSATFRQRMVLLHRDPSAPMILATTGYDLFGPPETWADYRGELTRLTHGNQLIVEHRFFGTSIADIDDRNWEHLNVRQSATDSHNIRQTLGEVYSGTWIGTGVSKGGMTAIFHHTQYPDDLDGIVPYVAPISFGLDDPRYIAWLDAIGPTDGDCRQRVEDFGVALIARVLEVAPEVEKISPGASGLDDALVAAAVAQQAFSFKWGFWQAWGSQEACDFLPAADAAPEKIAPWAVFSPEAALGLEDEIHSPYSYQVANELGSQGFRYDELEPYFDAVDWSVFPDPPPLPWTETPDFNPQPMLDVDTALRTRAENVLAIYGAWDPWTAGRIEVDDDRNSHVLIAPGIGHAARIAFLAPEDRTFALERLSEMAGVVLDTSELESESPLFSMGATDLRLLMSDAMEAKTQRVEQQRVQQMARERLRQRVVDAD